MNNCCCVFGHSEIKVSDKFENELNNVFLDLINRGYRNFYFGGFGMFDSLCHKVISKLKQKHSYIQRFYCLSDPRHQIIFKRPNWLKDEDFEEFIYLPLKFDYWYSRIYFRNCAMIDLCDVVVFYVEKRKHSGAYKAYEYAKKRQKEIINLMK